MPVGGLMTSWEDHLAALPEVQRKCEQEVGHCPHPEHLTCCLCGYVDIRECANPECDASAYLGSLYCWQHTDPAGGNIMQQTDECGPCTEVGTAPIGRALFKVRAQGASHADITLTCAEHLATTVKAYGRQGFESLVSVVSLGRPA